MADTVSSAKYLDINLGFADDDTRRIKLANPRATITTEQIQAVDAAFTNTSDTSLNLVVGDRAGAQFTGILTVDSVTANTADLDLSE